MKTLISLSCSLLFISFISCASGPGDKTTGGTPQTDSAPQPAAATAATPATAPEQAQANAAAPEKKELKGQKAEAPKMDKEQAAAPAQPAPAQTAPAAQYAKVALHRFSCNGQHLYTTSMEEGMKAGCTHDGVTGYIYTTQAPGTQAFYRFSKDKTHFYTTNKDEGLKNGFLFEGIIGYVNTTQVDGTKPLYRYNKPAAKMPKGKVQADANDRLYTFDENEGTKAGYKYEGIAAYISQNQ